MRLIDADALCKELQKEFGSPAGHGKLMRINYIITHAPTIDAAPVRHGKWIEHKKGFWRALTLEAALEAVKSYYEYALTDKTINKPLAWALYQAWREADKGKGAKD